MAKAPKVYKTSSLYIIITTPFGKVPGASPKSQQFADIIGLWIWCICGQFPDTVFVIGTMEEVIVKMPKGTDKYKFLGAHFWRDFLTNPVQQEAQNVSVMYEYKFEAHGSPEQRNWLGLIPTTIPPTVPHRIKQGPDYPRPSFSRAPQRPYSIASISKPLKASEERPITPPSPPEPEPKPEPKSEPGLPAPVPESNIPSTSAESAFTPYEPPAHHPSHNPNFASTSSATSTQEAKIKRDPYEEDDSAASALKVKNEPSDVRVKKEPGLFVKPEPQDGVIPASNSSTSPQHPRVKAEPGVKAEPQEPVPLKIKAEPQEYQPSPAWKSALASSQQIPSTSSAEKGLNSPVKRENPEKSEGYEASEEWREAWRSHSQVQAQSQSQVVKRDPSSDVGENVTGIGDSNGKRTRDDDDDHANDCPPEEGGDEHDQTSTRPTKRGRGMDIDIFEMSSSSASLPPTSASTSAPASDSEALSFLNMLSNSGMLEKQRDHHPPPRLPPAPNPRTNLQRQPPLTTYNNPRYPPTAPTSLDPQLGQRNSAPAVAYTSARDPRLRYLPPHPLPQPHPHPPPPNGNGTTGVDKPSDPRLRFKPRPG